MSKQIIVLFCPLNMVGPINAAIGMGEVLRDAGHKVVFAVKNDWNGKLKIHGFEEEIMGEIDKFENKGSVERNVEQLGNLFGPESRIEKMKIIINETTVTEMLQELKKDDHFLEEIVKRVKPDVILIDNVIWIPSLMDSGIPWVTVMTCNPLTFNWFMSDEKLPPMGLGLPTNGDPNEWRRIQRELDEAIHPNWVKHNDWVVSKGSPPLPENKMMRPSPYLNIYMFPKELDYTDIRPYPPNFFRFDCLKRTGVDETFELPEKLRNRSGKLIYLSMGSMGSGNVELMKRLISMLSKSKHKYIVSKGLFGDQYQLPDNMWGQNYLPQIKILPIIDLLITHGGNNTLTETLYHGKRFLVMPIFFDQYDNAQRLVEKGLSIELNPFECTKNDLNESIEKLLNDEILEQKITSISKRIQSEQSILKLPQLLLNLIK